MFSVLFLVKNQEETFGGQDDCPEVIKTVYSYFCFPVIFINTKKVEYIRVLKRRFESVNTTISLIRPLRYYDDFFRFGKMLLHFLIKLPR